MLELGYSIVDLPRELKSHLNEARGGRLSDLILGALSMNYSSLGLFRLLSFASPRYSQRAKGEPSHERRDFIASNMAVMLKQDIAN